jgi:hypothetical protein
VGVLLDSSHGGALGPVAQNHLLQARQMQALSFTAHIPLWLPIDGARSAPARSPARSPSPGSASSSATPIRSTAS